MCCPEYGDMSYVLGIVARVDIAMWTRSFPNSLKYYTWSMGHHFVYGNETCSYSNPQNNEKKATLSRRCSECRMVFVNLTLSVRFYRLYEILLISGTLNVTALVSFLVSRCYTKCIWRIAPPESVLAMVCVLSIVTGLSSKINVCLNFLGFRSGMWSI